MIVLLIIAIVLALWTVGLVLWMAWLFYRMPMPDLPILAPPVGPKRLTMPPPASVPPQSPAMPTNHGRT